MMTQNLKKLKGKNKALLVEEVHMIGFQDFWLMKNRRVNTTITIFLKKVTNIKKKTYEKLEQEKKRLDLKNKN